MVTLEDFGTTLALSSGEIGDLVQVNVLVGRNNSGKSTVLDALVMMRCTLAHVDYLEHDGISHVVTRRVNGGRSGIDYDDLWFQLDTSEPIYQLLEFRTGEVAWVEWKSRGGVNVLDGALTVRSSDSAGEHQLHVGPGDTWAVREFANHTQWE